MMSRRIGGRKVIWGLLQKWKIITWQVTVLRDTLEEGRGLHNHEASKNGHENRGVKREIDNRWMDKDVVPCMLSCVWLFATPWTVAHQAPLSMVFSRQEYWSGLPFPIPGNLPEPGVEPASPSPALAGGFVYHCATWEAPKERKIIYTYIGRDIYVCIIESLSCTAEINTW